MTKPLRIIGIPMDFGQARRGVDMGPSALRYAGLNNRLRRLGQPVEDYGNVEIPIRDTWPDGGGLAFLPAVVTACQTIYQISQQTIAEGYRPIFLGGDHSMSIGTIGGVTHHGPVGVLWIDAHGDFNTPETSPSGNLHGMPLAALTGLGVPELVNLGRPGAKVAASEVVLIGVRDLDPAEREGLRQSEVTIYTMRQIDEQGMARIVHDALGRLSHCQRLHISLDMDSLDPREAPGVGTPVPGGLTYREAHLLMELLADDGRVGSVDVVEINPILDDRNRTARIALGLLASLLGQTIL